LQAAAPILASLLLATACRSAPSHGARFEEELGPWRGHFNYIAGYKRRDAAWRPARDAVSFGLFDFDLRHDDWPISLAGGLVMDYSGLEPDVPGVVGDNSGTYEWSLGLRKIWERKSGSEFYIGGGGAVIGGSVSNFITFGDGSSDNIQQDSDSTVGSYAEIGMYWPYTQGRRSWTSGIQLRWSHADIELFGNELEAGGFAILFSIGHKQ